MEFYQTAVLVVTVLAIAALTARYQLPSFIALVAGALLFAILAKMSWVSIGDAFSLGFAQTVDSFGLVIIAGSAMAVFAERSGVAARIASSLRLSLRGQGIAAIVIGLCASLTASAPVALALLKPWHRLASARAVTVTTLALALSAGQALIFPSIYAVATGTIFKVTLSALLLTGIPLAILAAVCGWLFVSAIAPKVVKAASVPQPAPGQDMPPNLSDKRNLLLPTLIPLVLLFIAAVTQIPTEPFGNDLKDLFVFFTRPTVILTLSLGLALLLYWRWDRAVLSQDGWLGSALAASVAPILAVGAAGGFVGLIQATGMAELVAERIAGIHLGILVPFLMAATLKILQGSPLVATLSTAGMIEPLLAGLGLDDATGRALATAAIGGGIMIAHVNDPYFWLVSDAAETSPAQTLALYTLGTLIQACAVAAALVLLGAILL